jgi:hypothetical protein
MLKLIGAVFFAAVCVLSVVMARKGLSARHLLSFHQAGTGRRWDELSDGEQAVGLALTRTVGLGFACAALALAGATAASALAATVVAESLAGVALAFCLGLIWINHALAVRTAVETPWRGSLVASALITAGMVLVALI